VVSVFSGLLRRLLSYARLFPLRRVTEHRSRKILIHAPNVAVISILTVAALFFIETPIYSGAFSQSADLDAVLEFAKGHTDGRYLVEHAIYAYPESALHVR